MCDKPKTSVDHVPPECLFPPAKETGGKDLKRNLITVPSCNDHNLRNSKDDEHLWYVLSMCESVNETALSQASGRLGRAIQRSPSLLHRIMRDAKPATISDASGSFETLELTADGSRLNSSLEKIGRGLYFHRFGRKWTGGIKMDVEFLTWKDELDKVVAPPELLELRRVNEELFASEKKIGENPEVFYFSAHSRDELGISALRLVFYGGAKVTMLFGDLGKTTLAEKMFLLAIPTSPGRVEPWLYKDSAVLFSARENLFSWVSPRREKLPTNVGIFALQRYEDTKELLSAMLRAGRKLVCIDPEGDSLLCLDIGKVVGALESIIQGKIPTIFVVR